MILEIKKAEPLGEYKLQLFFNTGKKQVLDFKKFLLKSKNPVTSQFLNKKKFNSYSIQGGDIIWGDYEMCFPIWDLYQGKI